MRGYPLEATHLQAIDDIVLSRAAAVVPIGESRGEPFDVIGMRHDVDHSLEKALRFARWEYDNGYRAEYFILHDSPYWDDKAALAEALDELAVMGHVIGFHNNGIATALRTGRDAHDIVHEALDELRGYGFDVKGVVAHGDILCHKAEGGFVNDEMFVECTRPSYGNPDREITVGSRTTRCEPRPWSDYGFEYDPNWLREQAIEYSDSGSLPVAVEWTRDGQRVMVTAERAFAMFPCDWGRFHFLIHPCWWAMALEQLAVAA